MIGEHDRLELPPGVHAAEAGLHDRVRDLLVPLNETARALLFAGSTGAMADVVSSRFGVPRDRALTDARIFAIDLNRHQLLNVHVRGRSVVVAVRWLLAALVLARHRTLPPWPARRIPLPRAGPRAAGAAAAAALPAGLAGSALALAGPFAAGLPADSALAALAALALGVAAHEAGHVLALRDVPAFVARRGPRVAVVHARLPPRAESMSALGGSLAGIAFASATAGVAWLIAAPQLAAAVAVLVPHALTASVVTRDGRRVCAAL